MMLRPPPVFRPPPSYFHTLHKVITPEQDSQTTTGLVVCLHRQRRPPGSPFGQCSAWCSPRHLANTQPGTRLEMQWLSTAESDLFREAAFCFVRLPVLRRRTVQRTEHIRLPGCTSPQPQPPRLPPLFRFCPSP